jgi:hypothetical protein
VHIFIGVLAVLGMESRASHMLDKGSATKVYA